MGSTTAAQHYRLAPKISKQLAPRQQNLPARLREISWKAQVRLHKKYWAMTLRGKRVQTIQVAVARELVGFIWASARHVWPTLPEPTKN
jgi:transposase